MYKELFESRRLPTSSKSGKKIQYSYKDKNIIFNPAVMDIQIGDVVKLKHSAFTDPDYANIGTSHYWVIADKIGNNYKGFMLTSTAGRKNSYPERFLIIDGVDALVSGFSKSVTYVMIAKSKTIKLSDIDVLARVGNLMPADSITSISKDLAAEILVKHAALKHDPNDVIVQGKQSSFDADRPVDENFNWWKNL